MKTSQVNSDARCPACLSTLDGAIDPFGAATPKPGDIMICAYCSNVLVLNTDLTQRTMRRDELEELPASFQRQLSYLRFVTRGLQAQRSVDSLGAGKPPR